MIFPGLFPICKKFFTFLQRFKNMVIHANINANKTSHNVYMLTITLVKWFEAAKFDAGMAELG